jgi:prepilin-type N-terminal cleavage/methylation domain-containing protein
MIKKIRNYQAGFTYEELIIVLAIFAVLSSVVMFNYNGFQERVDIENLANEVALQVVQAQNASLNGVLPPSGYTYNILTWKPSYGVYFSNTVSPAIDTAGANNKNFIYFVDLSNNSLKGVIPVFNGTVCTVDCINEYTVPKSNKISRLDVFYTNDTDSTRTSGLSNLTVAFTRPSSEAFFYSDNTQLQNVYYVQIAISSPDNVTSSIELYPSGRVQIN